MLLSVADLIVDFEESFDFSELALEYKIDKAVESHVVIRTEDYRLCSWPNLSERNAHYMESSRIFYRELLKFNGFYLHSSAVEYGGKAYLFSGPSGMGKSTHTGLWMSTFGDEVKLFNDDKPALRRLEDRWYAYGTPWSGKNHININMKVPLAGICFLKQAPENKIRRLGAAEVMQKILPQTIYRLKEESYMDLLLSHLDKLIREIPIFELENRPEPAAAQLSYETMRKAAEEAGL